MAEVKRGFEGGKMNRDLDDRLLPEGQYRDALNVGIGRSEGADVGAVENLKGNDEIAGQTDISGTTIGSITDQSSNTIYWFTTSNTTDAIHEYNETTGVRTLIQEPKAREADLPSCVPDLQVRTTEPPSMISARPAPPPLPAAPRGYCNISSRSNYLERADGSAANTSYDFVDNTVCAAPTPVVVGLSVEVENVQGQLGSGDITLTAVASGGTPPYTYEWYSDSARTASLNTGDTTSVTDPGGAVAMTITRYVTVTDSATPAATANGDGDAVFTVQPTQTFTVTAATDIPNTTAAGGFNAPQVPPIDITAHVSVTPNMGYRWADPTGTLTLRYSGDPVTSQMFDIGQPAALTGTGAISTFTGTAAAAGAGVLTFGGATVEAIPVTERHRRSISYTINNNHGNTAHGGGNAQVNIIGIRAMGSSPIFIRSTRVFGGSGTTTEDYDFAQFYSGQIESVETRGAVVAVATEVASNPTFSTRIVSSTGGGNPTVTGSFSGMGNSRLYTAVVNWDDVSDSTMDTDQSVVIEINID